jgi:hypothetical protein
MHRQNPNNTRKSARHIANFLITSPACHDLLTKKYRSVPNRLRIDCSLGKEDIMALIMETANETANELVRNPLAWAEDCSTHARLETEPQARDAYAQLAQEFESVSAEIEGLISTFEALARRKRNS